MIYYEENKTPVQQQVLQLYQDANWKAYTHEPEKLMLAIQNSLYVLTAKEDEQLVGLIRVVGDGLTIIYIQDILVLNSHKRKGIGKKLILKTLNKYKKVRQMVLLTDDNSETRGFYEAMGLESCDKGDLVAFTKLNNRK